MSLTKPSLAGNNLLIPCKESLVSDIPAEDGKTSNLFFYSVIDVYLMSSLWPGRWRGRLVCMKKMVLCCFFWFPLIQHLYSYLVKDLYLFYFLDCCSYITWCIFSTLVAWSKRMPKNEQLKRQTYILQPWKRYSLTHMGGFMVGLQLWMCEGSHTLQSKMSLHRNATSGHMSIFKYDLHYRFFLFVSILMYRKIMYTNIFKGTVSRDFWLLFFSWISFPQAPEYTIRAISNFSKIFNHKSFNYFVWTPLGSRVNL